MSEEQVKTRQEFEREKSQLIADHPFLKPVLPGYYVDAKFCAANIRIELKKEFPETKFSVTSGGALRVKWIDGPSGRRVDAILNKYKSGRFDIMQDIYESSESPWNAAFGGTQYIFSEREFSESALDSMVDLLYLALQSNMDSIQKESGVKMKSTHPAIEIPGLDIAVPEALDVLARAWNFDQEEIETEVHGRNGWLIDMARRALATERSSTPALN